VRPIATPTNMHQGLTSAEADARLRVEDLTQLPRTGRRRLLGILPDVLSEPMFGLLLASGLIYNLCFSVRGHCGRA
jgi:Ca2+-transporting ATPase